MSRLLITFLLIAAFAAPARAQYTVVRAGDEVRVKSPLASGRFTVQDASVDTLVLRDSAGISVTVPMATVSYLSISRGPRSPGRGALRGAGIGFASGALLGIVIGLASGDDSEGSDFISLTAEEKAVAAGVVLGGAGAIVGALIGVAAPGVRWERVPLARSARIEMARGGGIALAYAIRF